MKFRFTPIVHKVIGILQKEGFTIERMSGSHIIINKKPLLRRPIVIPNKKRLSNRVRLNLINACEEAKVNVETIRNLNEMLRD